MSVEMRALMAEENDEVYQMFQEIPAEEDGFENPAHGLSRNEFAAFCQQDIAYSQGQNLPQGYVPATTYVLFVDSHPAGIAKFRHYLNDALRRNGGHIGYSVRPSYRGKGYGNRLLTEVLRFVKSQGVDKALLTIREYNTRSRKVCEHGGGVLEKIVPGQDFNECFYWIDVK